MKKILVALLVLALVAPAMADVAITSSFDDVSKNLTISFAPTAATVRGIAVTVTVNGAAVDAYVSSSFNTFVDYAFSTPGYTVGAGHPLALETAAGVATLPIASGTPFAVSVGYLDQAGAQAGLTTAGTVAVLHLTSINAAGGTVAVAANATRGGAVVGDTIGAVTVSGTTIPPQITDSITGTLVVAKTTAAPAIATRVNGGRVETFVASGVTGTSAIEYQFTWGDTTVSPWGAATQTHTYTYAAAAAYNVTAQARLISNPAILVSSAALALTSEPVKSSATAVYAAWASFNRPNCWAFQRNCKGDIDGLGTGFGTAKVWVNTTDLTTFSAAFNKQETPLRAVTNGICADNDRAGTGFGTAKVWVNTTDLGTFSANFNKQQTLVPVCVQTNYWYWTN